jgi:site-specific DNA-methyltransferase (adenine-specific)
MKTQKVNIELLKENPDNPRTITDAKFEQLVKSIKDFPEMLEIRPLVADKDYRVLGGNMRLRAAKAAGLKKVPVILADNLTEAQKREFVIKDNVGFGEWEWEAIIADWPEAPEWGLDIPDFAYGKKEAVEDDYEIPDEIQTDIVLGDLFEIGQHRLLCGDSTDSDAVARLMDGQKADISFTSPPYNAGKTATELKMGKESKYLNDSDNKTHGEYLELLTSFTNNSLIFSIYSFVNVQSIAGNKTVLIDYLYNMKEYYADTLIWQKQTAQPAMAKNVLNSQFEYIHCFSNKANRAIGVKQFRGTLSNVIEISKQTKNEVKNHNATFPVAFPHYFIENFSVQSCLDLFLGSGTTMVAAHQLNRKCYGMELDPKYCQVILDRMRKLDPAFVIKKNGVTL